MSFIGNIIRKVGQAIWSGVGLEPPEQKRLELLEAHMEYIRDIAENSDWGQRLVDELEKFTVAQLVPNWDGVLPNRTDPWTFVGNGTNGPAALVRLGSPELIYRLETIAERRGLKLNDVFIEAFQDFVDNDVLKPKSDDKLYPATFEGDTEPKEVRLRPGDTTAI